MHWRAFSSTWSMVLSALDKHQKHQTPKIPKTNSNTFRSPVSLVAVTENRGRQSCGRSLSSLEKRAEAERKSQTVGRRLLFFFFFFWCSHSDEGLVVCNLVVLRKNSVGKKLTQVMTSSSDQQLHYLYM